jgi:hypothetical protein
VEIVELGRWRAFWTEGDERTAVFLPGRLGGPFQPAFAYLRQLLAGAGWSVLALAGEFEGGDHVAWARERALASIAFREPGLVIAKSLSSFAAPVVDVPAVWLTPLLHEQEVRAGIRPPALLVGGTADPSWDGDGARALGVDVLELDRVTHALEVDGDAHASLDAMHRIVAAFAES